MNEDHKEIEKRNKLVYIGNLSKLLNTDKLMISSRMIYELVYLIVFYFT